MQGKVIRYYISANHLVSRSGNCTHCDRILHSTGICERTEGDCILHSIPYYPHNMPTTYRTSEDNS